MILRLCTGTNHTGQKILHHLYVQEFGDTMSQEFHCSRWAWLGCTLVENCFTFTACLWMRVPASVQSFPVKHLESCKSADLIMPWHMHWNARRFVALPSFFAASLAYPCCWAAASVKFIVTLEWLSALKDTREIVGAEESYVGWRAV